MKNMSSIYTKTEYSLKRKAVIWAMSKMCQGVILSSNYTYNQKGGKVDYGKKSVKIADLINSVSTLDSEERVILKLRFILGHTLAETASILSKLLKRKCYVTTLHRKETRIVEKLYEQLWLRGLIPKCYEYESTIKAESHLTLVKYKRAKKIS